MGLPNGIHHLAINTGDIKAQIDFFTDVLGAELKALYWMHGQTGVVHAFLRLNDLNYIAFVQTPEGAIEGAARETPPVAASMNHVALSVASETDLLALRDRIRSKGLVCFGPVDHTFCKSIYLGGPEGLGLEIATNEEGIDERAWVDPDVARKLGISTSELARYVAPGLAPDCGGAVPQPVLDRTKPFPKWSAEMLDRFLTYSDAEALYSMGNIAPPVDVAASSG